MIRPSCCHLSLVFCPTCLNSRKRLRHGRPAESKLQPKLFDSFTSFHFVYSVNFTWPVSRQLWFLSAFINISFYFTDIVCSGFAAWSHVVNFSKKDRTSTSTRTTRAGKPFVEYFTLLVYFRTLCQITICLCMFFYECCFISSGISRRRTSRSRSGLSNKLNPRLLLFTLRWRCWTPTTSATCRAAAPSFPSPEFPHNYYYY